MGELTIGAGAFRGLSAILAEYVTAKAFAAAGDDVAWKGGGGKMYDIATDPVYTDVKKLTRMPDSEQRRNPGCVWQLRRPEQGAFAIHASTGEARRTHLALVRCDPEPAFQIRDTPAGATVDITFASIRVSYVRTEIVNQWLEDVTEAHAYLLEADLDSHHYAEISPGGVVRFRPPDGHNG